jgi:S1-C subfamily serine protease
MVALMVGVVAGVTAAVLAFGVFDVGGADQGTLPGAGAREEGVGGGQGFDPEALYQQTSESVVLVLARFGQGPGGGQGIGSGFVADDDGHIITNAHVVSQGGAVAEDVEVGFLRDGTEEQVPAEVVGVDQSTDIAVLRVDTDSVSTEPLPLGDSADVSVGEPVVAIGNPLGFSFSLTAGIVSGIGRNLQAPNGAIIPNGIQTDAAINQGNSGGPLIDAEGRVIGVNEQIASPTGGFTGLGFAVPIDTAKEVLRQIVEEGDVQHAYLGIAGQTITPGIADLLDLPVERGVLIAEVQEGGGAAEAGLRGGDQQVDVQGIPFVTGGDVITAVNGEPLESMEDLGAAIAGADPGDEWELTIVRDGTEQQVSVTLGVRES